MRLMLGIPICLFLTVHAVRAQNVPAALQGSPATTAHSPTENAAFEKMKSLVGEWEYKRPNGSRLLNIFRIFGNGSALLHLEQSEGRQDVITIFYAVGSELRGDHYCFMKNQPRFVAVSSEDPNIITFELREITNLSASPEEAHMHSTTWRFIDTDHLTQEWHMFRNGQEVRVNRLEFTRIK